MNKEPFADMTEYAAALEPRPTPRTDAASRDTYLKSGQMAKERVVPVSKCVEIERELAESIDELESNGLVLQKLQRERDEAIEQRDKLAAAALFLADVAEKNTDDTDLWNQAIDKVRALAARDGKENA